MNDRDPGKLTLRRYREGDARRINDTFNEVFQKSRDHRVLEWQFLDNPARYGEPKIGIAEGAGGRVVGFYGATDRELYFRGDLVRSVQVVDNFVHPDFRKGTRLQFDLRALAGEVSTEQRLVIGFGFPTEVHYRIGRVLGYRNVGRLPPLHLRLNLFQALVRRGLPATPRFAAVTRFVGAAAYSFIVRRRLPASGRRWVVREVDRFDDRIDRLWHESRRRYTAIVRRDHEFLNWRFARCPNATYTVLLAEDPAGAVRGYLVLRVVRESRETVGHLVDFLYDDGGAFDRLVREGLLRLIRARVDHALVLVTNEEARGRLERAGFAEQEFVAPVPFVFDWLSGDGPETDDRTLREARNWYVTYGDTDIV
jgi:hypothetical protein